MASAQILQLVKVSATGHRPAASRAAAKLAPAPPAQALPPATSHRPPASSAGQATGQCSGSQLVKVVATSHRPSAIGQPVSRSAVSRHACATSSGHATSQRSGLQLVKVAATDHQLRRCTWSGHAIEQRSAGQPVRPCHATGHRPPVSQAAGSRSAAQATGQHRFQRSGLAAGQDPATGQRSAVSGQLSTVLARPATSTSGQALHLVKALPGQQLRRCTWSGHAIEQLGEAQTTGQRPSISIDCACASSQQLTRSRRSWYRHSHTQRAMFLVTHLVH